MTIKTAGGFEILRVSDIAYKGMTTEIAFNGEQIARLDMEHGANDIAVELFTNFVDPKFSPRFPLNALLDAIATAKTLLLDYPDPSRSNDA